MPFFSFASFVRDRLVSEGRVYPYDCFLRYNVVRKKNGKKPIQLKTCYHIFRCLEGVLLIEKAGEKVAGPGPAKRQYYRKGKDFKSSEWANCQRAYDLLIGYTITDAKTGEKLSRRSLGKRYKALITPSRTL